MREHRAIELLRSIIPWAPSQLNQPFESDAEFFKLGELLYGITIDEHSPEEDRFSRDDPEALGHNLVTCTTSDLLAAGVVPAFYLHAMTLPSGESDAFLRGLFAGMQQAMLAAGCILLGGDTSFGANWRYVGVALGPTRRPISRGPIHPGDQLYSTGPLGGGNRQALLGLLLDNGKLPEHLATRQLHVVRFACRRGEAEAAWPLVRAGIDTSDGLIHCLMDLLRMNPERGILVDSGPSLLDSESVEVLDQLALPRELLLFGPEGEYEIVFALAPERVGGFVSRLTELGAAPIRVGEVIDRPGLWWGGAHPPTRLHLENLPDPRQEPAGSYLEHLIGYVESLRSGDGTGRP